MFFGKILTLESITERRSTTDFVVGAGKHGAFVTMSVDERETFANFVERAWLGSRDANHKARQWTPDTRPTLSKID